jgi:hypothetical protein
VPKVNHFNYDIPSHTIALVEDLDISADKLFVDAKAQRVLDTNRVRAMQNKGFQAGAVGTIIVSERPDGTRWIIDGQHRRQLCLDNGVKAMRAEVHFGLTEAQEAMLFLVLNRESAKPTQYDEYQVGLAAGLDVYVEIDRICKAHGLTVAKSASPNGVQPLAIFPQLVEGGQSELLDRTLSVCEGIWGRTPETWHAKTIGSVAHFLMVFGDQINDAEFCTKLSASLPIAKFFSETVAQLAVYGSDSTNSSKRQRAGANVLVNAWNKGRRNKLAWSWN